MSENPNMVGVLDLHVRGVIFGFASIDRYILAVIDFNGGIALNVLPVRRINRQWDICRFTLDGKQSHRRV
ncbi:hypothetical protein D3C73_1625340 [compost metagenome]